MDNPPRPIKKPRLRDTFPDKEVSAHKPVEVLFCPDEVFYDRRVSPFGIMVAAFDYMETQARGACFIPPYCIQYIFDVLCKRMGYSGDDVERERRKLCALGYELRDGKFWRTSPHLLNDRKTGHVVPGKFLHLVVWLNPMFTPLQKKIITEYLNTLLFKCKSSVHFTDAELAQKLGYAVKKVGSARRDLMGKRKAVVVEAGSGKRALRKPRNPAVPYYKLRLMGITSLLIPDVRADGKKPDYFKPLDLVKFFNQNLFTVRVLLKEGLQYREFAERLNWVVRDQRARSRR